MSTTIATGGIATPGSNKQYITLNIRAIDNGFLLEATKSGAVYERIELSFPTLPKLLKAVGTFLKEGEGEDKE